MTSAVTMSPPIDAATVPGDEPMNGMIAATIHGTGERMSRPTPMAKRTLFGLGLSRSMGSSCLATIRPQNETGKHCNFLQFNSEHEIVPQTAKRCPPTILLLGVPLASECSLSSVIHWFSQEWSIPSHIFTLVDSTFLPLDNPPPCPIGENL